MRAPLLQAFVLIFCFAMLAACSGGASDASAPPAPVVTSNNDKLPACTWGTSNWSGCNWQ